MSSVQSAKPRSVLDRPLRRATNALLAGLPIERFTGFEPVFLPADRVLHEPNRTIRHVYFPLDALVSLFTDIRLPGDVSVEVALVGNDGMVGVSIAHRVRIAPTQAAVQVAGFALRAASGDFVRALEQSAVLRRRALRYATDLAVMVVQSTACSRNHNTRQRLARWLLVAHERLGHADIEVTQERLARALSTRRAGVNEAAVELKRLGLIRYRRGIMEILDEAGLKAVACPCLGRGLPGRG